MKFYQYEFSLSSKKRGFHLVTQEVLGNIPAISEFRVGILNLLIKHTSASITLNENADPSVRRDFERHMNTMVPENAPYYEHTYEGQDDMPAHIKSTLIGSSIQIPITNGKLNLGTWQGIYLCEHRDYGGARKFVATLWGEPI